MRDDPETRLRNAHDDAHYFPPAMRRELKTRRFDYGEAIGALSVWAVVLFVAVLIIGLCFAMKAGAGEFRSGELPNHSLCRGWIDTQCSCSHRACWEAGPDEFEDLNDGRWRERSSGQVIRQTDWSRDGVFIACAWKRGDGDVLYRVGKGNPLSCVFPPVKGF